jgi:uncharacterized membrane protein YgcG
MRELTKDELLLVTGGNGYLNIFDYLPSTPGSALTIGSMTAHMGSATMQAARNDVRTYFLTGNHILHAPGSVIPWQTVQVNWSLYGNANMSYDEVIYNLYMHGATGTNPYNGGGSSGGGNNGGGGAPGGGGGSNSGQ